jgi:hypothetical protein
MRDLLHGVQQNFWASLLAAMAIVLLGKLVLFVQRLISQTLKMRSTFSIAGVWVGQCQLPSYGEDSAVELYRLGIHGENVRLVFFNYRAAHPVLKHEGAGVYRGKRLAAFYQDTDASCEVGTFVVTLIGNQLKGVYMQHDERAGEQLFISKEETFSLIRARLPTVRYLKMLIGRPPYETYEEAHQLYLSLRDRGEIDPR